MNADTAFNLVRVFSVLSVLSFGGGKGIFPQMREDVVSRYHWLTPVQFAHFYTIGKLVPGPTTIMSVLIGLDVGRVPGAVLAAGAIFIPSSVIMFVAARLWRRGSTSPWHAVVGRGLAPAIIGLSWASAWAVGKGVVGSWQAAALVLLVATLSLRTKLPTVGLILGAGLVGAFVL